LTAGVTTVTLVILLLLATSASRAIAKETQTPMFPIGATTEQVNLSCKLLLRVILKRVM